MENLTKLHQVLTRDGYTNKTFEEFIAAANDESYQEKIYEVVTRDKLFGGSRPEFNEKYFSELETVKKKDGSESIVDVEGGESTTTGMGEAGSSDSSEEPHQFQAGRRRRGQPEQSAIGFTGQFEGDTDVRSDVGQDVEENIGFVSDVEQKKRRDQPSRQQDKDVRTYRDNLTDESRKNIVPQTGEKDTWLERTFGKNEFTDFFGDLYRATETGRAQGAGVDEALELMIKGKNVTDQDVQEYIAAAQRLQQAGVSDEMKSFNQIYENNGGGLWGFIKGVASNPTVVPQLFTTSVTAMLNPASLAAAGTTTAGFAGVGALGGLAGAGVGAVTSIPWAIGAAGGTLETGLSFSEFLQEEVAENGDAFDLEGVRKVLEDPDAMFRIRSKAAGRGLTIGIVDRYSAGLAGKAARSLKGATKASKAKAVGAGVGIEAVGGSTGEAAARLVAGQEMDVAEIGFEGIAGTATAPISVGVAMLSKEKFPGSYKVNGEEINGKKVKDFIEKSPDKDFAGMKLNIKDDPKLYAAAKKRKDKLKKKNQLIKELKKDLPAANVETANKIVDLQLELDDINESPSSNFVGKRKQANRKAAIEKELTQLQDDAALDVEPTAADIAEKLQQLYPEESAGIELLQETDEGVTLSGEGTQQLMEKAGLTADDYNKLIVQVEKVITKEKQDAIQKQSTEEVDVQELTEDGPEVGTGDTEGGTTVEGESQAEVGTQTQEEVGTGGAATAGAVGRRQTTGRDRTVDQDTEQEVQDLQDLLKQKQTPPVETQEAAPVETEVTMDEVFAELNVDPADPDAIRSVTPDQIVQAQETVRQRKQQTQKTQTETTRKPTDVVEVVNEQTRDIEVQNAKTGERVKLKGEKVVINEKTPGESNLFEVNEVSEQIDPIYKDTKAQTKQENTIRKLAKKATQSIKKILPNTKIVLHKTEASYNAATNQNSQGSKGKSGSRGLFDTNSNTIHINMPHATSRTIAHEVFHAILMNNLSDPQIFALTEKMAVALKKSINDPAILKELNDFTAKYKGKKAQVKNEEFVAEFIGILAENYQSMNKPSQNLVQRFLSRVAAILGAGRATVPKTPTDTQSLLNILAGKIKEGQAIEATDIEFITKAKKKAPTKKATTKKTDTTKKAETKKKTFGEQLELDLKEQKFDMSDTQQKVYRIAAQSNINENSFLPANLNEYATRKALQRLGYSLRPHYRSYGDRGLTGYSIRRPDGKKWNLPQRNIRYQMFDDNETNVMKIINEARDNNFSRASIREVLIRNYNLTAKEADAALNIELDNLYQLPPSYGNIGLKSGIKLFTNISNYANKLFGKKLTEQEILTKTLEHLETRPEYKNATKEQQQQMYADTQKALGLKPTKDVGSKIRKLRNEISQRKKGKRDLQKIKRQLRNYMRQVLPVDIYNKSEVMKMVRKITDATEANIDMITNEVTEFATTKQVEFLKSTIDNILNGKYETVQSGRKKGKIIDTDTKKRLENIKDNLMVGPEATAADVIERNAKLNEEYKKLSEKINLTPDEENKMVDLMAAMSLNNAQLMLDNDVNKVESLQRTEDMLAGILGEGRQVYKEQLEKAHQKYKDEFKQVYKAVTGLEVDLDSPEGRQKMKDDARVLSRRAAAKEGRSKVVKYLSKVKSRLGSFFKSSESLAGLMEIIASAPGEIFGGAAKKLVYDKLNKSTIVFKKRMLDNRKMVLSKLKELHGRGWRGKMRKASAVKPTKVYADEKRVAEAQKKYDENPTRTNKLLLRKTQKEEMVNLSDNQIAYLWMQYQDPANIPSFANPDNINFGPDHQRVMKQLLESTGAEVVIDKEGKLKVEKSNVILDFADWQVNEFFPSLYAHYDATYQDIYRTNLPWNKHYGGRIYRTGIEPDPLDLLGDKAVLNQQVGAASTKVRIKNDKPIQPTDQMDGLMTYLTDMEWFAAYGTQIRDINKLFGNPTMRRAIVDTHGESTMRLIDHHIKNIAARGINTSKGNNLVDWFNNLFIGTRLGLNPTIMIKQLTSIPTYANDIGVVNYMKYAVKNKVQFLKVWKEIMKNSVYLKDRMSTDMRRTVENYSQSREVKFMPGIATSWWSNAMMAFVRVGDMGAIMLGGMPNYSYYKAQFKKNNPNATDQQAIEYAIEKFENDTKNTQQSMDLQDKDFYQSSDAITRSLNMFLTTPKQYLRKEFSGLRNMYRGAKNLEAGQFFTGFKTFTMYHMMMPALFQFVSLGLPGLLRDRSEEDDEDMLRSIILGNFNALFIAGDLISGLADAAQEKQYADDMAGIAVYDAVNEINKLYLRAQKLKDPEKKAEAMKLLNYRVIELFAGGKVPVTNIARYVENLEKASRTGEILPLLNYSNYMQERGKPEPVKVLSPKEIEKIRKQREEGSDRKREDRKREDRRRDDRTRDDRRRR